MDYYDTDCNSNRAQHRASQCTFIHGLVNSRPICSVLCWPYSSWALNGCHEHGTDNDNGIRERKWETGWLSSPLQTYARFFGGFVCVCVYGWVSELMHEARRTCAEEYLQPLQTKNLRCDKTLRPFAIWMHMQTRQKEKSELFHRSFKRSLEEKWKTALNNYIALVIFRAVTWN